MGALKIETTFFIKHQWMPLDRWKKKYREKLIIKAKWYCCQMIEHKSCNGHIKMFYFFNKYFLREK